MRSLSSTSLGLLASLYVCGTIACGDGSDKDDPSVQCRSACDAVNVRCGAIASRCAQACAAAAPSRIDDFVACSSASECNACVGQFSDAVLGPLPEPHSPAHSYGWPQFCDSCHAGTCTAGCDACKQCP